MTTPDPWKGDFTYWRDKAMCGIRNPTPEQIDKVADLCVNHADQFPGGNPSIWHAAAIVWNRLDRCQCYPCCKARGENN